MPHHHYGPTFFVMAIKSRTLVQPVNLPLPNLPSVSHRHRFLPSRSQARLPCQTRRVRFGNLQQTFWVREQASIEGRERFFFRGLLHVYPAHFKTAHTLAADRGHCLWHVENS